MRYQLMEDMNSSGQSEYSDIVTTSGYSIPERPQLAYDTAMSKKSVPCSGCCGSIDDLC